MYNFSTSKIWAENLNDLKHRDYDRAGKWTYQRTMQKGVEYTIQQPTEVIKTYENNRHYSSPHGFEKAFGKGTHAD